MTVWPGNEETGNDAMPGGYVIDQQLGSPASPVVM